MTGRAGTCAGALSADATPHAIRGHGARIRAALADGENLAGDVILAEGE